MYETFIYFLFKRPLTDWRDVWLKFERGELILQTNDHTNMAPMNGKPSLVDTNVFVGFFVLCRSSVFLLFRGILSSYS